MASVETTTTLNGLFKQVYGDKVMDLIPESDILFGTSRIKFVSKKGREGLAYNQPVLLSYPSSATWGLNGPTLNANISSQMGNAVVTGSAITMRDVIAYDAAARSVGSAAAFEAVAGLIIRNLYKAIGKFSEIDMLYGNGSITSGVSLGQSTSIVQNGGSGGNCVVTLTYASWAPALFSGFENALVDAYQAGTKINTNAGFQIVSVNVAPVSTTVGGTITLTGNASDLNSLVADTGGTAIDFYWTSAYGNNQIGLSGILQNTGSIFGINAATYSLWLPNTFANPTGTQLTFSKVQQAAALAVSRGLDEELMWIFSPVSFADLVNEQAGARRYDSSYKNKDNENGSEALTFWGPNGKMEIVPHLFCHQGEGFGIPPSEVMKVGPMDKAEAALPGLGTELFFQSPLTASYEMRLFTDFATLVTAPAKCIYFSGITNSQSA